MGIITSTTGLNSGIDIAGTITKLMAISAKPVNALTTTNTTLTSQETALTQLSALLLGVQNVTQSLGQAATYASQNAASSNASVLAATVTGAPAQGTYQYTPLKMAQSQQLLSPGFQSATAALGGGTVTYRPGARVDRGINLSNINGGQGFARGTIRITDRSGASAMINLSNAQNIDDVAQAINTAGTINVTASTQNGRIVLTDNTGQSITNLKVQEVNGGTTAASLGLSGINVAANSATGDNILTLSSNLQLGALNDGMGVQTSPSSLGNISYTLHSGKSGTISLTQLSSNATLSAVAQQINTQSNDALQASISADGQSLVVKDTTSGSGTLSIANAAGSTTASELGLVGFTSANILSGGPSSVGNVDYTLHSGQSGTIDLSQLGSSSTLGDVIQQINTQSNGALQASLSTDGQSLVVEDTTSGSGSFSVSNATGSTEASNLGLAGSMSGSTVTGGQSALGDIDYTLHNGLSRSIDLSKLGSNSTLGDVIQQINTQSHGALQASISADGQSLVVKDMTSGGGTLSISNAAGSSAASDLGLLGSANGSTLTGSHVLGGLKTVLLSDLNGGQGLGTLGYMKLTDQNGSSVNVNLGGSVTLQDVVDKINSQAIAATVGIAAEVNAAGNGIQLVDTTGAASGTLAAANSDGADDGGSDGLNTAVKLGFATASAPGASNTGMLNGGDLHLRTVSQNTLLSSFNGGAGIAAGTIRIAETNGSIATISVTSSMQTIGDVINAINRSTTGIHAAVNSTGDGIVLQDTAHGSGTLMVTEGSSTTAHDLNLLGAEKSVNNVQTIDGTTTRTITLKSTDTLTSLQDAVNSLGAGLSAGIVTDGSSNPFRLLLTATQSGRAGSMLVDTSQLGGMSLQEMTQAQDALLALGNTGGSKAVLVSSSSNDFSGVLPGVALHVNSATGQSVSVTVGNDGTSVATILQTLVTDYNSFRTQLATDTAYNTTTNTGAVLTDDGSALQLDSQLSQLLTSSFGGAPGTPGRGSVQSLADVGITVQNDGTLGFNPTQFDMAWTSDPTAVQQFFTTKTTGLADRFGTLIGQLAGTKGSVLSARAAALKQQITDNQATIDRMNLRLNDEQQLLYTQFYNMDLTIGKLKNTLNVINLISTISADGTATRVNSSSSSSG